MSDQFKTENNNVVVLYYYALACLLVKKPSYCLEALRLVGVLYELNHQSKRALLIDYYKAKSDNIAMLVKSLTSQP